MWKRRPHLHHDSIAKIPSERGEGCRVEKALVGGFGNDEQKGDGGSSDQGVDEGVDR